MKTKYLLFICAVIFASSAFVPLPADAETHALGTNILFNGTVYTISTENNKTVRRPYTSAGAFLSYSFNSWAGLQQANSEDLSLPEGSFVPPRDGTIMCSDRGADLGTCYLVTEGRKAGFTAEYIFQALGYSYKWALYGDVSFLSSTVNISRVNEAHRPGVLISHDSQLYLITVDGLKKATPENLKSWGYWEDDAILSNNADDNIPKSGNLTTRDPSELSLRFKNYDDSIDIVTKLPNATAGQPYSVLMKAEGGTAPYSWSTVSTTYPSGCCILGLSGGSNDGYGVYHFNTQSGDYVLPDHKVKYKWVIEVTDIFGKSTKETLELTIQ